MHTIACALPNRANDTPADRCRSFLFSPYNARKVRRWKWSLPGYSRTWYLRRDSARIRKVSRSNETKLIQSHYRELTALRAVTAHRDLLSSVFDWATTKKERVGRTSAKKGERKGVRLKILSRRHHSPLRSWDGQWGSKRFMSHFASIYLPGRQTFAREPCRTFFHTPSCY